MHRRNFPLAMLAQEFGVPSTYVQYVRYVIRSNFFYSKLEKNCLRGSRTRVRNSMMYSGDAYTRYMLILSVLILSLQVHQA